MRLVFLQSASVIRSSLLYNYNVTQVTTISYYVILLCHYEKSVVCLWLVLTVDVLPWLRGQGRHECSFLVLPDELLEVLESLVSRQNVYLLEVYVLVTHYTGVGVLLTPLYACWLVLVVTLAHSFAAEVTL